MVSRRFLAAALLVCLGLTFGSCAQSSAFVADHWPHWAGGLPDDAPPRPGSPGYSEFVAHGQADQGAQAAQPVPGGQNPAGAQTSLRVDQAPPAAGQPAATGETSTIEIAPIGDGQRGSVNAVPRGLY